MRMFLLDIMEASHINLIVITVNLMVVSSSEAHTGDQITGLANITGARIHFAPRGTFPSSLSPTGGSKSTPNPISALEAGIYAHTIRSEEHGTEQYGLDDYDRNELRD
ncbi:hypothetical protein PIIN_09975 [Serendipita indica DSM 11827]|uniref:Uncharacterized protein n=1 Tax=Serendipita indica (strain DSM 11827) TaxID=1109443 RepID=G4TXD2_SERID|nr:hypothetical protein PIIN_09975 [Serendipita indica DSM 11827]